jgi:hypothetical protein
MGVSPEEIVNHIELLLEDGRELRTSLRQAEAPLRRAVKRINAGEQPMAALRESGAGEARIRVNESLKKLEEHPRQLVQRLAKEARGRP